MFSNSIKCVCVGGVEGNTFLLICLSALVVERQLSIHAIILLHIPSAIGALLEICVN